MAMDLNPTSGWEESTINNYLDVEWDNYIPQINGFAINVGYQRNLAPQFLHAARLRHGQRLFGPAGDEDGL